MQQTSSIYEELYHYTNWHGLLGILEKQLLWATHYKFLNDSSEIQLFMHEKFPELLHPHVYEKYKKILNDNPVIKKDFEASGQDFNEAVKHV